VPILSNIAIDSIDFSIVLTTHSDQDSTADVGSMQCVVNKELLLLYIVVDQLWMLTS
jgi:hypothetical protein